MSKLIQSFTIDGKIVTNTGKHLLHCRVFEHIVCDDYDMEVHLYLINDKNKVVGIIKMESSGGAESSSSLDWNLGL